MTAFATLVRPIIKDALPGLKASAQLKIAEQIIKRLAAHDRAFEQQLQTLRRENAQLRKTLDDRQEFTRRQIKATAVRFANMLEIEYGQEATQSHRAGR